MKTFYQRKNDTNACLVWLSFFSRTNHQKTAGNPSCISYCSVSGTPGIEAVMLISLVRKIDVNETGAC